MSTVIKPFIIRLDEIEKRIPRYLNRIVLENAEVILSIIKDNQLSKGLNSFNSVVGTYKSITSLYAFNDRQASGGRTPRTEKKAGQAYNFEWTGELFDSLNLKGNVNKNEYEIFSSVGKIKKLEEIYNTKLGDLTEDNNDWINKNILIPKLYEYIFNESVRGLI
jgi:hypothetical protein